MRLRLVLSFVFVVLVSVATVVVIVRLGSANEVRAFMFRGGMNGTSGLINELESYYNTNGSWQGVESLLQTPGHGMGAQGMGTQGVGARGQGRGAQGAGGTGGQGNIMNQRLLLADAQGNLLADSSGNPASGKLSAAELENAVALHSAEKTVGYLVTDGGVTFTLADESLLVSRLSRAALTAGLVGAGLSLLIAFFLAFRLLRPVRELTHAAAQLARGNLAQRVPVRGDDELATLGQTFNQMASSLQESEESRRAMTADIAHELRNPLAVQRANLEALQDGIYPLTSENLEPVLEQNRLLTRLVEDLGTLASADSGQLVLECSPTDLPALVQHVAERFKPQAAGRQISLDLKLPQKFPSLSLDPGRIEQILGNLISNALRYTPQNGNISFELHLQDRRNHKEAVMSIHDSGPGIPEAALPHIFERFFRADHSRSREEGGSGLGLAIARQLAEAHGGSLTAANHPHGGAVFTLTLPLSQ
jgi:two-component system sensor histidine kinase BaeS